MHYSVGGGSRAPSNSWDTWLYRAPSKIWLTPISSGQATRFLASSIFQPLPPKWGHPLVSRAAIGDVHVCTYVCSGTHLSDVSRSNFVSSTAELSATPTLSDVLVLGKIFPTPVTSDACVMCKRRKSGAGTLEKRVESDMVTSSASGKTSAFATVASSRTRVSGKTATSSGTRVSGNKVSLVQAADLHLHLPVLMLWIPGMPR